MLVPGEQPLVVFISSVMDEEMSGPRQSAVAALGGPAFLVPWAFEFTPASTEPPDDTYMRKVREADVLLWLVGSHTSESVQREVREALTQHVPLLAVRLSSAEPDTETDAMVAEVGSKAKWAKVEPQYVREAVALSLGDEIVRAWRSKPGRARSAQLDELGRLSRARCIQRWRAAGLTRSEALELADDQTIGNPPIEVRPTAEQPLRVIEADVGSGKSLTGERLFQEAIAQAIGDPDAPVPVWLPAHDAHVDLLGTIRAAAHGLGELTRQGANVIIDGADEVGAGSAVRLLNAARIAVETWPGTRIVITSRPLAPLERIEEAVLLPPLSEEQSLALVSHLAGRPAMSRWWPSSVNDAIRRPLFALLLGIYLRSETGGVPRTTGELLRHLVTNALPEDEGETAPLLWRLARLSTDLGDAPIPAAEVADRSQIAKLGDTGLLVQRDGRLSFGLPILTQWFAAQSLAAGEPSIDELLKDRLRLDRWRYAFVIAVADLPLDAVTTLLEPVVRADVGFASEVVVDSLREYGSAHDGSPALQANQAGAAIRHTTTAWLAGLGPVASLLSLANADGTALALGIATSNGWLTTRWRIAGDSELGVLDLPDEAVSLFGRSPGWGHGRSSRPTLDPAWPWRWSFDDVVRALAPWVKERLLPLDEGPLWVERAWAEALALRNTGSLAWEAIPIDQLNEVLASVPADAVLRTYRGTHDLAALRARVSQLQELGEVSLEGPWPPPDRQFTARGGWVWSPYSPDRLLERTRAVFEGAMRGYVQLVERWLPALGPRLQTYVTMPARLIGTLQYDEDRSGFEGCPTLEWRFEPLPFGDKSTVSIRPGGPGVSSWLGRPELERAHDLLVARRPRARQWISATAHSAVLDIFGSAPATALAFDWLQGDLKRLKLID